MLSTILLAAAAFAPQGPSTAPVVINEFSYDDSGTDDLEFIELYNRSNRPVNLTGWTVVSMDPSGTNFTETITPGTILQPGDFWVFGQPRVPNLDQPFAAGTIMEDDQESLTLRNAGGAVIDTLVYECNKGLWSPALAEGEGLWGNHTLIESSYLSWSRYRDGYDTNNNGRDFRMHPWSPGTSNNLGNVFTYAENWDAMLPGAIAFAWPGAFAPGRVIDPLTPGPGGGCAAFTNPNSIPASPQGGNAGIFWDECGGGNGMLFASDAGLDQSFEAWVYIDSRIEPVAGNHETWSIGIQGGVPSYHNSHDPQHHFSPSFGANGNTGFAWCYQATDTMVTLSLVDHNDGAWAAGNAQTPESILTTIVIQPGVNDGWQRLLLEVRGNTLVGRFGGNIGMPDGQLHTSTITPSLGGIFIGYREFVLDNLSTRPVTIDDVRITTCSGPDRAYIGHGTANTVGMPELLGTNTPTVGGSLDLGGTGHVPSSGSFLFTGFQYANPLPIDLAGAPAGARIYVNSLIDIPLSTDVNGNFAASFPIPAMPGLCGATLAFQSVQIDFLLPVALPIAPSNGWRTTIRN